MMSVGATLFAAITAFTATNIDDILLLTLCFSQVGPSLQGRHIVLGQYLGFTVLCLLSLPGFLGGQLVPATWIGLLGLLPLGLGLLRLFRPDTDEDEAPELQTVATTKPQGAIARFLTPQTYSVAAITIANGGDNIGIYVPLFAQCNWGELGLTLLTFYSLIALWCYLGYVLSQHPAIARLLSRYGQTLVPFVLIALGMYILIENESYQLIPGLAPR